MSEKNSGSQLPNTSSSSRRMEHRNEELPSTSGIKAEFSIKITIAPEDKSLQSLDEDDASFETGTSMEPGMIQLATKRHQSVSAVPVAMENVAPPPYHSVPSSRMENNARIAGPQMAPAEGSPPPYTPYVVPRINSFNSVKMRNQFILKVFVILAIQLLITIGFIALIIFDNKKREFVLTNDFLYYLALIITGAVYIFLVCLPEVRRTIPLNYVCLGFLTFGASYSGAYISCLFDTYTVMIAVGSTAGICSIITCLAIQKKVDVTGFGVYLGVAGVIVLFYGIVLLILTFYMKLPILFTVYAGVFCLLFCMYLLYDMQKILGGRRIQLLPNEYILGAITLYTDIVVIFLNLFCLVGQRRFY